jgi:hypothetical protein
MSAIEHNFPFRDTTDSELPGCYNVLCTLDCTVVRLFARTTFFTDRTDRFGTAQQRLRARASGVGRLSQSGLGLSRQAEFAENRPIRPGLISGAADANDCKSVS